MSGQPCGYVYRDPTFFCARPEADHRDGRYGHPYAPLERRTGKDRRGGQVAAALDSLVKFQMADWPGQDFVLLEDAVALAAAPQAAPADGALREALEHDVKSLRATAYEQMVAGGHLQSAALFEGQVVAYDEVLRRLAAADAGPTLPSVEALDGVYRERNAIAAALIRSHGWPCWVVPAPDAEGWRIVYAETPQGQVSWHIGSRDADLFADFPTAPVAGWDGHSTDEKYRRLAALAAAPQGVPADVALREALDPVDVEKLAAAVDHLLDGHGCDLLGYEEVMGARDRVRAAQLATADAAPLTFGALPEGVPFNGGHSVFADRPWCPVRSSVTRQPCLLAEGHDADTPERFHRYAAADAAPELLVRLTSTDKADAAPEPSHAVVVQRENTSPADPPHPEAVEAGAIPVGLGATATHPDAAPEPTLPSVEALAQRLWEAGFLAHSFGSCTTAYESCPEPTCISFRGPKHELVALRDEATE